jgi:hypothetical protein
LKGSLDCPVPRLTLLFFGAAEDVPEAAKMVTAGTACLHFLPSGHATASEEVKQQRNHGDDQQKVNQPAGDVERKKS